MNDPDSTVVRSRPAPAVDPDATVVRPVMQRPPPLPGTRDVRPERTEFPATRSFHRDATPSAPDAPMPERDRDATTVYATPAPIHSVHPRVTPASTETRAVIEGGSTEAR